MKKIILLAACAVALGGCGTSTKMPHNPPQPVVTAGAVSLGPVAPANRYQAVQAALDTMPKGKRYATVTAGQSVTKKERADVGAALVAGGVDPERIRWAGGTRGQLDVAFRTVSVSHPVPEPVLGESHWYSSKTVTGEYGYSTEANMAAQMVNVEELNSPERLDPANPMAAVGAVERYQKGQVRGLPEQSIEAGKAAGN